MASSAVEYGMAFTAAYNMTDSTADSLTLGSGESGCTVTANAKDAMGNNYTVALVEPATAQTSTTASISGNAITVDLATSSGTITSTAADVVNAINGITSVPVTAAVLSGESGSALSRLQRRRL